MTAAAALGTPADLPVTVNSQEPTVKPVQVHAGEPRTLLITFKDGTNVANLSDATVFVGWASNQFSTAYQTATVAKVNGGTGGQVRATFAAGALAWPSVTPAKPTGSFTIFYGANSTYRQGALTVTPNPHSGVAGNPFTQHADLSTWTFSNEPWVSLATTDARYLRAQGYNFWTNDLDDGDVLTKHGTNIVGSQVGTGDGSEDVVTTWDPVNGFHFRVVRLGDTVRLTEDGATWNMPVGSGQVLGMGFDNWVMNLTVNGDIVATATNDENLTLMAPGKLNKLADDKMEADLTMGYDGASLSHAIWFDSGGSSDKLYSAEGDLYWGEGGKIWNSANHPAHDPSKIDVAYGHFTGTLSGPASTVEVARVVGPSNAALVVEAGPALADSLGKDLILKTRDAPSAGDIIVKPGDSDDADQGSGRVVISGGNSTIASPANPAGDVEIHGGSVTRNGANGANVVIGGGYGTNSAKRGKVIMDSVVEVIDPNSNTFLRISSTNFHFGTSSFDLDGAGDVTATNVWLRLGATTSETLRVKGGTHLDGAVDLGQQSSPVSTVNVWAAEFNFNGADVVGLEGDNLGDHQADADLQMSGFAIMGAGSVGVMDVDETRVVLEDDDDDAPFGLRFGTEGWTNIEVGSESAVVQIKGKLVAHGRSDDADRLPGIRIIDDATMNDFSIIYSNGLRVLPEGSEFHAHAFIDDDGGDQLNFEENWLAVNGVELDFGNGGLNWNGTLNRHDGTPVLDQNSSLLLGDWLIEGNIRITNDTESMDSVIIQKSGTTNGLFFSAGQAKVDGAAGAVLSCDEASENTGVRALPGLVNIFAPDISVDFSGGNMSIDGHAGISSTNAVLVPDGAGGLATQTWVFVKGIRTQ